MKFIICPLKLESQILTIEPTQKINKL